MPSAKSSLLLSVCLSWACLAPVGCGAKTVATANAQVYYKQALLGHDWQPRQPTTVARSGHSFVVNVNVPVPPLNWHTSFDPPVLAEWVNGRGFEPRSCSNDITISSVENQW